MIIRRGVWRITPLGRGAGPLQALLALPLALLTLLVAGLAIGFGMLLMRGPRSRPLGEAPKAKPVKEPGHGKSRSYAELVEAIPLVFLLGLSLAVGAPAVAEAKLLVPMDDRQTDHLKAYGLTFWILVQGQKAEWLLNYRGGSFLLQEGAATEREA